MHFAEEHPGRVFPVTTWLNVNRRECDVLIELHWTMPRVLQFKLGLTRANQMCDCGACGSCTPGLASPPSR